MIITSHSNTQFTFSFMSQLRNCRFFSILKSFLTSLTMNQQHRWSHLKEPLSLIYMYYSWLSFVMIFGTFAASVSWTTVSLRFISPVWLVFVVGMSWLLSLVFWTLGSLAFLSSWLLLLGLDWDRIICLLISWMLYFLSLNKSLTTLKQQTF